MSESPERLEPDLEASEAVIQARGVWRRFGSLEAVRGVDLSIRRGEVFGFLGPNGAGKSTLIRMLVGLLQPSEGELEVLGYEMPGQVEELRPKLGYMTQRFSLYDDLTVEENLQFAGEVFGLSRKELRARVEEVLLEHSLDQRRQQRPATLSGGWKQRLALAAATIHRPELLFLDEPTAGVDPDRRRDFWHKLFELAADGTTVLVSTHYMDEAIRCHRLCMLREGERVALGRPSALVDTLRNRVVAVDTSEPEAAVSALEQVPQVASVTQLGNRLHVLLDPDESAEELSPQLVLLLTGSAIGGVRAQPTEPSLEDVFVALNLGERLLDEQESN